MEKKISDHRVVITLCALGLAFILGGLFWALAVLPPGMLILHFNDLDGITSIGSRAVFIFMGAFGSLVTSMNFFIAIEFDVRDKFLGKFLAAMTLVFGILLFIA